MNDTCEISEPLNALMRGLVHGTPKTIYKYHRELFQAGDSVIPAIESELLALDWSEIKFGAQVSLLTGLLSLVNDIDETQARRLGQKIRAKGCSKTIDSRIKSIEDFTLNEFKKYSISGVTIFVSKVLKDEARINRKITSWLALVPKDDLKKIERIYITPETDESNRGTYMPILCSIKVEWDITTSAFNPLSYIFLLIIESTFYHEIGHHAYRHTFGQDPDQEKEADRYATNILKTSHPILRFVVGSIKKLLGKKKESDEREELAN